MKLISLVVEHFRCVRSARVEFGPGLNVLYGPNDLGKSSLATAIRAALLLQVSSKEAEEFVNWQDSGVPRVELVFESEPQRVWRVRKTFGSRPEAYLDESRDGVDFHVEARSREVDGRLSEILGWGLAPPGGKGRPKGLPVTFLSTALLGEQDQVAAIFGQTLAEDSDESGKKRLLEALQAAAEDPRFKAVLEVVQAAVDEAFSASGSRRRGKDSPWTKLAEEMRRATDNQRQCEEQLQKSTGIEQELVELSRSQLEGEVRLREAGERRNTKEAEYERTLQRESLVQGLDRARDRWNEVRRELAHLGDQRAARDRLKQRAEELAGREQTAKAGMEGGFQRWEAAKTELGNRRASEERGREAARNRLLKELAEVGTLQERNEGVLTRVGGVEAQAKRVCELQSEMKALVSRVGVVTGEYSQAQEKVRALDQREATLGGVSQLLRLRAAQSGVAEADEALARIETWRTEARVKAETANALEDDAGTAVLPTEIEMRSLKDLERRLQLAEARTEVGLYLELRPLRELRLVCERDGAEGVMQVIREGAFTTDAAREIQISIEDVGEIRVSGGESSARAEAESLRVEWVARAEPVLLRAGLANLEHVAAAMETRRSRLELARRTRDEARSIEQRIGDQQDWNGMRAEWLGQRAQAELALTGMDQTELESARARWGIRDAGMCDVALKEVVGERVKVQERERAAERELDAANATQVEKEKGLGAASRDLEEAYAGIEGYSKDLFPELLQARQDLGIQRAELERELQTLEASDGSGLQEAEKAVAKAVGEHDACKAEHVKVVDEGKAVDRELATIEGELRVLGEAAARLDEGAVRGEVEQIAAELEKAGAVSRHVTSAEVESALASEEDARRKVQETTGQIQTKRGALEHVGGAVANVRAESTREALRLLQERERGMELESAGWQLLRETLLEAEQEEGVHLGRILGEPILKRFSELTGGRYGRLALGAGLETESIVVAGEGRPTGALSVGTRDQLSIIFRLTLAEQLGSAVVLDDQLTQSDTERMTWLQGLIRKMAVNTQVVVFTCRAGDYLTPAELKGAGRQNFGSIVRPVNLADAIERSR